MGRVVMMRALGKLRHGSSPGQAHQITHSSCTIQWLMACVCARLDAVQVLIYVPRIGFPDSTLFPMKAFARIPRNALKIFMTVKEDIQPEVDTRQATATLRLQYPCALCQCVGKRRERNTGHMATRQRIPRAIHRTSKNGFCRFGLCFSSF